MSEHRKETAFLRHIIALDGSEAGRELESRLRRAENDERCVVRAASLVGGATLFCALGLGYGTVLEDNFFFGATQFVADLLCAVGVAALVSLLVFLGLVLWYHKQLREARAECRRLMMIFLEGRLGSPPRGGGRAAVKAVEAGRGTTEAGQIVRRSEPSQP